MRTNVDGVLLVVSCLFAAVGPSWGEDALVPAVAVRVLDTDGTPLPGITARVRLVLLNPDHSLASVRSGQAIIGPTAHDGRVHIDLGRPQPSPETLITKTRRRMVGYELVLTGQDRSPALIRMPIDQFPAEIRLPKGVRATIELQGKAPSGEPKVVPADDTFDALMKNSADFVELKREGNNTWTCILEPGQRYVIGWISDAMYGYCSEPFVAAENARIRFAPGMPATLAYNLKNPPKGVKATPAEVLLLREIIKDGKPTFVSYRSQKTEKPGIVKMAGLAAGTYQISARTSGPRDFSSWVPILYENRVVVIQQGVVNQFEPNYPEIDTTVEKDDVTIRGTLYSLGGKPLPGKTVHLIPMGTDHRLYLKLGYPPEVTDRSGRFEFAGVRPNVVVSLVCEGANLTVLPEWTQEDAAVSLDFVLGVKDPVVEVGRPIEDLVIDWHDGSQGRFSDLRGKTVVVDVWATWCAPCIRKLPSVNSLAREFGDRDKLVFITLSVDRLRSVWEEVVEQSGWEALRHGWLDPKRNSHVFKRPIPYYMVIDDSGVVRAEGSDIDIRLELGQILRKPEPKT